MTDGQLKNSCWQNVDWPNCKGARVLSAEYVDRKQFAVNSLYNRAVLSAFYRLWVIVTSTTPLKVYLFDGGVVIFGSPNKKRTDVDMPADDEVGQPRIQECLVMLVAVRCESCFLHRVRGKALTPPLCRIRPTRIG